MPAMWSENVPMMHVVPVMEGYLLHYEVRTGSGSTIIRHHDEKAAILWCRENAFEYVVTHRHLDH